MSRGEYEELAGMLDEDGNALFDEEKWRKNSSDNGRFHSEWLSMMYPRLKLARDLLREDGVIFISIDDGEVANLRKMCDEIFGGENFEGHIHWRRRHNQPNDRTKMIGIVAEHIIAFAKNSEAYKRAGVGKIPLSGSFSNPDNDPRGPWASKPWKVGSDQSGSRYVITSPTGVVMDEEWMGEEKTFEGLLDDNRIVWPRKGSGSPRKKYYKFEREEEGQCATNWWPHEMVGHNSGANAQMTSLMGAKNLFSNPKPIELLYHLILISNVKSHHLVLDFFSGSATAAHAVMQLNAEDGGRRRHIMVQLPEPCDEKSEAFKAGYKTIAEIGKERIRRAGKRILQEWEERNRGGDGVEQIDLPLEGAVEAAAPVGPPDIGFRVLKVDSSSRVVVRRDPVDTRQGRILELEENLKPDRGNEDLVFQVLLDWGVDLTLSIEREQIGRHEVYFVDQDALAACFSHKGIDEELIRGIAARQPLRAVFRGNGFASDSDKINVADLFNFLSPRTELKTI